MIRLGTLRVANIFRVLSKPVESTNMIREATQNHTRTVKIDAVYRPSEVMVTVIPPKLPVHTGVLPKNS